MNKERTLVTLLREISKEEGYDFRTYSYDWVKQISKDDRSMFVHGYNFPLNDTSFTLIANDKACTSEVLTSFGIPNVEHSYFMSPNDLHYVKYLGVDGNWNKMTSLLEKYGKIIIKPNSGTGGADLHIADSREKLEKAVSDIFSKTTTLCICPYHEIENEFRVIILNGVPRIVFKKVRPFVVGNGVDNISVLCAKQKKTLSNDINIDADYIPKPGEKAEIGWKHNLGQGSTPEILKDGDEYKRITSLALNAFSSLGGSFASVDCVCIDGEYRILEVNSGVMMDNLALSCEENYITAKDIYRDAIRLYFKSKI